MRIASRVLVAFMIAAAAGCAQGSSDSGSGAAGEAAVVVRLPGTIEWPAVDGAVQYRIQMWDAMRLLFEESRESPRLAVTPAMRHSLIGVERAELRVRALAADGRSVGEVLVREYAADGG